MTASRQQIDKLAKFIMAEVPSEPSQSEGAVDTIIRVCRALQEQVSELQEDDELSTGSVV